MFFFSEKARKRGGRFVSFRFDFSTKKGTEAERRFQNSPLSEKQTSRWRREAGEADRREWRQTTTVTTPANRRSMQSDSQNKKTRRVPAARRGLLSFLATCVALRVSPGRCSKKLETRERSRVPVNLGRCCFFCLLVFFLVRERVQRTKEIKPTRTSTSFFFPFSFFSSPSMKTAKGADTLASNTLNFG